MSTSQQARNNRMHLVQMNLRLLIYGIKSRRAEAVRRRTKTWCSKEMYTGRTKSSACSCWRSQMKTLAAARIDLSARSRGSHAFLQHGDVARSADAGNSETTGGHMRQTHKDDVMDLLACAAPAFWKHTGGWFFRNWLATTGEIHPLSCLMCRNNRSEWNARRMFMEHGHPSCPVIYVLGEIYTFSKSKRCKVILIDQRNCPLFADESENPTLYPEFQ